MKPAATVTLEEAFSEPYASLVCYPKTSPDELQARMAELIELGVEELEFAGKASAFSVPVLGKGYVGIVVAVKAHGQRYALKMQRVDSERESLLQEAQLLKLANTVNVGPKFAAATKRFLLMELVDGGLLEEWLQTHQTTAEVRAMIVEILEQCWRLDTVFLDHGELSKAPKHILVNQSGNPYIVDFETASTTRNASNVTSVCQYLFQGRSEACKMIIQVLGERNRENLVNALRKYRKNRDRISFEALLNLCL